MRTVYNRSAIGLRYAIPMPSRQHIFSLLAALSASLTLPAADRYPVDWKRQEPEIFEHYASLVRMETSSPPGNETKAAEYLKSVLEKEGIPAAIYELEPGR